jgi:putative flippase GtrA
MPKIKAILKHFFKLPEKIRFIIIGGWNTVFGYSVFVVLWLLLRNIFHYQLVLLITYILTLFHNYFTLKTFVFKAKGEFKHEYPRCFISSILGLISNACFLLIFVDTLKIQVLIAQILSMTLTAIATYFLHKYFTFQMHKK